MNKSDEKLINETLKGEHMDATGREYRYQKDWTRGTEMYHVRCDNWEEFMQAVENMEGMVPQKEAFPNDSGKTATPVEKTQYTPTCPKHNKPLKLGQYGWYCATKDDSTPKGWCTYKPQKGA